MWATTLSLFSATGCSVRGLLSASANRDRAEYDGSVVAGVKPLEVKFPLLVGLTVFATFVPGASHSDSKVRQTAADLRVLCVYEVCRSPNAPSEIDALARDDRVSRLQV